MNKQELIEKLGERITNYKERAKDKDVLPSSKNTLMSRVYGLAQAQTLVEELEEIPLVTVPKFVADWIKQCKEKATLADCLDGYYEISNGEIVSSEDFQNWVVDNENDELTAKAWMFGYEVEKEPLYTVTINLDRKYLLVVDEGDGNDEISTTLTISRGVLGYRYFLTEKEIKSADENLWKIAEPVEE